MLTLLFSVLGVAAFFIVYKVCLQCFSPRSQTHKDDSSCCVFSGFDGKLLFKGRPAVGARIVRKVEVDSSERVILDDTTSNGVGEFSFQTIHDIFTHHELPKLVMHQEMFVFYRGKKYHIWQTSKRCTKEFSEFGGKPYAFTCELTDDERFIDTKSLGCIISSANWRTLKTSQ